MKASCLTDSCFERFYGISKSGDTKLVARIRSQLAKVAPVCFPFFAYCSGLQLWISTSPRLDIFHMWNALEVFIARVELNFEAPCSGVDQSIREMNIVLQTVICSFERKCVVYRNYACLGEHRYILQCDLLPFELL